tara:strand:+ start:105 stop:305 length:201 start_codon:yes stop_codon:yes gene_type:complete
MRDTLDMDIEALQKLVETVAKLNIKVRGSIRTTNADYEIETYYDEVVIEDAEGNEVVRAEIETYDP